MRSYLRMGGLLAAFGALLLAGPVRAEGPRPAGQPAKPGERKAEKERLREQIIDKLRAERMWKLTEALKLDEPTAARLFPLLAKFDDQERAIGKERGPIVRDLRDALGAPSPDSNRINALVEHLMSIRARRQALEAEKLASVRKVLSPAQMGKLLLLAPRIDEGFRERIREAVQQARQAGELRGKPGAPADDLNWP
jgi:Spy/CpxP family protein refolding chaperone